MAEAYQNRYWRVEIFDQAGKLITEQDFKFKFIKSSERHTDNPRKRKKQEAQVWADSTAKPIESSKIKISERGTSGKWIKPINKNGQQIHVSAKNRSAVEEAAAKQYKRLEKLSDPKLIKASQLTLREVLDDYYTNYAKDSLLSNKSVLSRIQILLREFEFKGSTNHPIKYIDLTSDMLVDWAMRRVRPKTAAEKAEKITSQTLKKLLLTLKHAADFCELEGLEGNVAQTTIDRLKARCSDGFFVKDKECSRRLFPGEYALLLKTSRNSKSEIIEDLIIFAVETGARRGEICAAKVQDFYKQGHYWMWNIPRSKIDKKANVRGRRIPISKNAHKIVERLSKNKKDDEFLFGVEPDSATQAAERIYRRTVKDNPDFYAQIKKDFRDELEENDDGDLAIPNLRFHDFRHEFISRAFDAGWQIQEVAEITGHMQWETLKRYTHFDSEVVAKKLSGQILPERRAT